jgi:serine/threonine protein kinase
MNWEPPLWKKAKNKLGNTPRNQVLPELSRNNRFKNYSENLGPIVARPIAKGERIITLGDGAFGRVNIERVNTGKVVTKYFKSDDTLTENIEEVASLKSLQGLPNVVPLLRINPEDGGKFPSVTLGKAKSDLSKFDIYKSWDDVYSVILQLLRGYFVLHSKRIAHRDVKPENALMTSYGEVWVSDFGKSKYMSPYFETTHDDFPGTLLYSSPELLLSFQYEEPGERDYFANDMWGIGCSIYEIITQQKFSDVKESDAENPLAILDYIFRRKGIPTEIDGETYRLLFNKEIKRTIEVEKNNGSYDETEITTIPYSLYKEDLYLTKLNNANANEIKNTSALTNNQVKDVVEGFPWPKIENAVVDSIMRNAKHRPENPDILHQIAVMVEKMLDYNPKTRMTIVQALQTPVMGNIFYDLPPEPKLYLDSIYKKGIYIYENNYKNINFSRPGYSANFSKFQKNIELLYDICTNPHFTSKESSLFVLDRCINYFSRMLNINEEIPDSDLQCYSISSFVIASSLCECDPNKIATIDTAAYELTNTKNGQLYSKNVIKETMNKYMYSDIQLLGKTMLDEIMENIPRENQTPYIQYLAGIVNYICWYYGYYSHILNYSIGYKTYDIFNVFIGVISKYLLEESSKKNNQNKYEILNQEQLSELKQEFVKYIGINFVPRVEFGGGGKRIRTRRRKCKRHRKTCRNKNRK